MEDSVYPSEETLLNIAKYGLEEIRNKEKFDYISFMDDIKAEWWMPSWGWRQFKDKEYMYYFLSTGGWSGNEDIIGSMQSNYMFWMQCWESSQRGGHYAFRIKLKDD